MKKLLKILGWALGGLIALLVLAVVVISLTFDPNKYKGDIIAAVKQATGRDLAIDGKLGLSFYPWLGVETGRLSLSNAPGFGAQPMARVESAAVKVAVLPLLRKQVVVDGVRLNGLQLHLARNAAGRTNWDDLAQADPAAAKPEQPKAPGGDASAALGMFTINKVEVHKSQFTWVDQTTGSSYAFKNVELTSGNVLGSTPAAIHLAFDFESGKPKVTRRVVLDGSVSVNAQNETVQVPDLRLALGDLRLQAQLSGTDIMKAPKLKGRLDIPAFNLRTVLNDLNLGYAPVDDKVLTKLALGAQLDYGPQAITVSNLQLTLDETKLTGKFSMQQKPRTAYQADLAIDAIDIDRYLPKAAPESKGGAKQEATPAKGSVAIPIALLRETEADAQLKIQKMKAFGIRSQDIVMKVAAHGGKVTLGPNSAKLYDGSYAGRTVIDASAKVPKYQFEEKLTGVQLAPFLQDVGRFNYFSGAANIALNLTAQGLDNASIKKTLNGTTSLGVKDGHIEGVDFLKMEAKVNEVRQREGGTLRNVVTALPEFVPQKGDRTKFTKLGATATITNGVVNNKDLAIEAAQLRVLGSGGVNLVSNVYENYTVKVNNLPPVIITGDLAAPKFRIDWNSVIKQESQQKIEQKKDELKNRLLDRLRKR